MSAHLTDRISRNFYILRLKIVPLYCMRNIHTFLDVWSYEKDLAGGRGTSTLYEYLMPGAPPCGRGRLRRTPSAASHKHTPTERYTSMATKIFSVERHGGEVLSRHPSTSRRYVFV
ncbi:hypothetical protein EVAR_54237_1 [Eumeta japonica]|uniref:Uncharacterized protein n=1 Tax=Eumeta variegata TaxID=151549 RepID=A0A4C1YKP5_EUMVA|nr:hypothetical protein EVAR_54237_1 [Eumeta japonica]